MTINNNNSGLDFLSLIPPGSQGDAYSKLAVDKNGVPIGDKPDTGAILSKYFGYSDTDTMESALNSDFKAIVDFINMLNISSDLPKNAVQNYLNSVNPTQPGLPPIAKLLDLSEKALVQGKIGGSQFSAVQATADEAVISGQADAVSAQTNDDQNKNITNTVRYSEYEVDADDKSAQTLNLIAVDIENARNDLKNETPNVSFNFNAVGGNPWLGGNVYVGFLVQFMEMQKVLMRNKVVQGEIEVKGMDLVVELAKTTAEMIMDIAKINQMIHITAAVMAGVSVAVSIGGLKATMAGSENLGTIISTVGQGIDKMTTSTLQAATDLQTAEKEGRKEILQAYRTLAQHMMDKASEAFKANTDSIAALLQSLDRIRENLAQAVAAALRK